MPPQKQSNLNTILLLLSIIGGSITAIKFVAPLHTMPGEMKEVRESVQDIAVTQAVQTEALATLAEVAADTKVMRRDVDRHEAQITDVQRRLETIERQP